MRKFRALSPFEERPTRLTLETLWHKIVTTKKFRNVLVLRFKKNRGSCQIDKRVSCFRFDFWEMHFYHSLPPVHEEAEQLPTLSRRPGRSRLLTANMIQVQWTQRYLQLLKSTEKSERLFCTLQYWQYCNKQIPIQPIITALVMIKAGMGVSGRIRRGTLQLVTPPQPPRRPSVLSHLAFEW